jgi:2-isopropylmalate synthase
MNQDLIHDWNVLERAQFLPKIEICDETLRDGIQSPSVFDPPIEGKFDLILLMEKIGITTANIGLPGAGPRAYQDVLQIAQFVRRNNLKLLVNCAARTVRSDIEPIARIQQQTGLPITASCFLGTSPIRQLVEDWNIDSLKKLPTTPFVLPSKKISRWPS